MTIPTTKETVEQAQSLLATYDAGTERFLDDLPTREKYAILALSWMISQGYEDFQEAYDDATRKVSAQELTKFLMTDKFLQWHLQDVLRHDLSRFEVPEVSDEEDE